jgi:hypothetical protein
LAGKIKIWGGGIIDSTNKSTCFVSKKLWRFAVGLIDPQRCGQCQLGAARPIAFCLADILWLSAGLSDSVLMQVPIATGVKRDDCQVVQQHSRISGGFHEGWFLASYRSHNEFYVSRRPVC